mgnify:CR=1 FL=1
MLQCYPIKSIVLSVDRMSINCTLAAGGQTKVEHTKIDYKGLFVGDHP